MKKNYFVQLLGCIFAVFFLNLTFLACVRLASVNVFVPVSPQVDAANNRYNPGVICFAVGEIAFA